MNSPLRKHAASFRKGFPMDEAGIQERDAQMAAILSAYRHAGGKLLFPETMKRQMHLWKEISMTVQPPLEVKTYPRCDQEMPDSLSFP